MATPTQTVQAPNEITIRIRKEILVSFFEMAAATSTRPEGLAEQLVEAGVADFRLRQITRESPLAPRGALAPTPTEVWRRKVDAIKMQRILHLLDQAVSVVDIAVRTGVSSGTIRRVAEIRQLNTNRTQVPRVSSSRGSRGAPTLFGQGERRP